MANTHITFDDVKNKDADEKFIDEITLKVAEIWDPYDVDFVSNPAKAEQVGLLEDADGEQIRFVSWENSDPPALTEGETYVIEDLFLVYGRDGDEFKNIFRSKTAAKSAPDLVSDSSSSSGSDTSGGKCPSCNSELTADNHHKGPGAPEIGWEYYECPECGQTIRPEKV